MAAIDRLVETKALKTNIWASTLKEGRGEIFLNYNKKVDTLTLLVVPRNTPTIVHYIDEHVALHYMPENNEVVGFRIESFQRSFLPQYTELQKVWRLSEVCELEDFGDLIIAAQKYEKKELEVAKELSHITRNIIEKRGLQLPVPA